MRTDGLPVSAQREPEDEGADERAARGQQVPHVAALSSSAAAATANGQDRGDESEGRLSPPGLHLHDEEARDGQRDSRVLREVVHAAAAALLERIAGEPLRGSPASAPPLFVIRARPL